MNQNSKKHDEKKIIFVYFHGKRMTLHGAKRTKFRLKKLGAKDKVPTSRRFRPPVLNRPLKLPRGHLPKRPKNVGPMKNGNKFLFGGRVLTDFDSARSPAEITTFQSGVTDQTEQLNNVFSVGGDFKHPNPQSFNHLIYRNYRGTNTTLNVNAGHSYGGSTAGTNVIAYGGRSWSGHSSTVYNKALDRLYDKLRGDIDISIDLAESHKTKTMMRDTLKAMSNLAQTFRKMKRSNPRDWGNLWLEFTYGWKPLVSTIYGAGKKLMDGGSKGPGFLRVTSSAKEYVQYGATIEDFPGYSGVTTVKRFYEISRVRFDCIYQIDSSVLVTLGGFTSLNPVSIAWELTPYSFVVDWFVNVGGYLRNFESACLYRSAFATGYVTRTSLGEETAIISGTNVVNISASTVQTNTFGCSAYGRSASKDRSLLTATIFPRVPKFDPKLGVSRLFSGAALLGQMLTSLEHSKGYGNPLPSSAAETARKRSAGRTFETASKSFSDFERELRRKNPFKK